MHSHKTFKFKPLSVAVASSLLALSSQSFAQDGAPVEEVLVTGIRAAAQASMDIKRDAAGVVDAISAEDMGKFPDTNLAESLQRITGVSISRTNGEGSEVTVRGFGGEFNMITLNGRTMPSANVYGGGSGAGGTKGGSTRAFDFANIASEGVSSVEVYKTGRASIATGGIGASININTAKPLDNPGLQASVGAKAVSDTTNRTGSDVTPELSGILSWTDDSEKFGVGLSLSHQQRDSGSSGVSENNWNIARWTDAGSSLYSFTPNAVIENPPAVGQLYGRPNDIRYVFSDIERTRTNAQLTLQFAPTDAIVATLDYTMAENELSERRGESTSWLANGNSIDKVVFSNDAVKSPLYIRETAGPRDQGYEQQLREQKNSLDSIGFNVDWTVSDSLSLSFDAHNSSMESLPTGPGKSGEIATSIGAPVQTSHWIDFSGDLPLYSMTINDGIQGTQSVVNESSPIKDTYRDENGNTINYPRWEQDWYVNDANPVEQIFVNPGVNLGNATPIYRGNNNGILDAGDIGSQVVRVFYADQTTDITQVKFDGTFEFDNGRFDFGVESRVSDMAARSSDRYMAMGDWGIANVGDIPVELFENFNLSDFEDYNASRSYQQGFKGNAEDLGQSLVDTYVRYDDPATEANEANGYVLAYNPNFSSNTSVEEDVKALYAQVALQGSLGDFETNIMAGFRYETTDVTSEADMLVPTYLRWDDNNDFNTQRQSSATKISATSSYDNLLPSIDFDIAFTDDIKGRASYSKTIARTSFGNLNPAASNFGSGGGSVYNGAQPTANLGNPGLIPLESNNFDVSAEWYFDDTSYASIGFFEKRVSNFVGTEQNVRALSEFGLIQDVTSGPRVQNAAETLSENNIAIDDTTLFVMTAIEDNPTKENAAEYATLYTAEQDALAVDPNAALDSTKAAQAARSAYEQRIAFDYNIDAKANDPEAVWQVSSPINNREAKLYGSELAAQHFFGDTGFGIMANYTIVRGDVKYVDDADPSIAQFALLGLSDTANLVFMYENYGVQARLAYNWRDEYLNDASRGSSRNPVYVEAYSQIDFSVSYEIIENLSVSVEGLNITGENIRTHGRSEHMIEELYDQGARYALGIRYTY